jgi:ubiquinone/menaquinone biosynthesis C-methylase UbiE
VPIDSRLYDREYFLSDFCEGWDRFQEDRGLSAIKRRLIELLDPQPGMDLLDAGCGRGEVLLASAERGARVVGVDYSPAAVEISGETLDGVDNAEVRLADVTRLPFGNSSFDAAVIGDVIEHLDHDQVLPALAELRRVLRPGGKLVIHTAPNRRFLTIGWPLTRLALRAGGREESVRRASEWIAHARQYHVAEQSPPSLRRAMRRVGFRDVKSWIDRDVIRSETHHLTRDIVGGSRLLRTAANLAGRPPLHTIFGNDIYAIGRR